MDAFNDHEEHEEQQAYDQGTFFGRFLNFADTNDLLQGSITAPTVTGVGASTMAISTAIGNRVAHTDRLTSYRFLWLIVSRGTFSHLLTLCNFLLEPMILRFCTYVSGALLLSPPLISCCTILAYRPGRCKRYAAP